MKPLEIVGKLVPLAGLVLLVIYGGPIAGAVAVGASGGAAGVKKLGKLAERYGLGKPHKIIAPAAVVGFPAAAHKIMASVDFKGGGLEGITDLLATLGIEGLPPWLAVGLFLWLTHQFGKNVKDSGQTKAND